MSNASDTDLLIQLLDGELSPAEREELLQRLENDPALQNEWSAISNSKELLQQYGEKKKIELIHREMMKELGAAAAPATPAGTGATIKKMFPGRTVKINLLRAVAAVLLLAVSAVLYPYFSSTPAKLFSSRFEPYKAGNLRGSPASQIDADYRGGNQEKTIADYQAGRSTGPQDDFLAGTVYLELKQPLAAVACFQSAEAANHRAGTHFLEPETAYYLGLAWLAAGEPDKALPVFTGIRADHDSPYHNRVSWWFMQKLRRLAARQPRPRS